MRRSLCLALTLTTALHPTLAVACGPTAPVFDGDPAKGVSVSVGRVAGLSWVPLVIDGEPVPEGAGVSLEIRADGKVSGTTGCNRFTATADVDAGAINLGDLAVTELACADPKAMEREAAWLKALEDARRFVVSPEGLWLIRSDGSVAACLS